MNANDYTNWLNGFVEINDGQVPNEKQWEIIKAKLNEVFHKVTTVNNKKEIQYCAPPFTLEDAPILDCGVSEFGKKFNIDDVSGDLLGPFLWTGDPLGEGSDSFGNKQELLTC